MERIESVNDLRRIRSLCEESFHRHRMRILVCMTRCRAMGCLGVYESLVKEVADAGLASDVAVVPTGCHGFCCRGPILRLEPQGILYIGVQPEHARQIVRSTAERGEIVDELCYKDVAGKAVPYVKDVPFFAHQNRVVFANCGLIDPTRIEEAIARGTYGALAQVLAQNNAQAVIDEISASGLRGRGGAGFPTGRKWALCRAAPGEEKYLVCNADEGGPGAFSDRTLVESDPHRLLEGMLIAAFAIGTPLGYVYVRTEYPLAVEHMSTAMEQARQAGLLGENILGSDFSFDIEVKEGAGAFVCGEETALIAAIEGKRGMPRTRPPFPAHSGVWGKPTNVNNVETFANISTIIANGADAYRAVGTEGSPGTKVFSLGGKIVDTGLIEVPMGTTLRRIAFQIGGGVPSGRTFKATQAGGPTGGCLPARLLDLPIDYDSLTEAGATMASGALVFMDNATCLVESARLFLECVHDESCGKCVPCRVGTKRMLDILERICEGEGREEDLATLEELGEGIRQTSLCALGQTAPNPVLSTIRYFRDEYLSHIVEKRCPAGACKKLAPAPCTHVCPANVNVPEYLALVGLGENQRAADLVRRRNPFAAVCGRVCTHPCEALCRRAELDDPVAVCRLKRVATDLSKLADSIIPQLELPETGKRVAVVGSGPAGLSAAYFLSLLGHSATVFEKLSVLGGMLRVGIPRFRLPESVLNEEIEFILSLGPEARTNVEIGKDIQLQELLAQYEAVFVSVGTHAEQKLGVENEGHKRVHDGVDFLRKTALGERPGLGRRVAVIGGGNVAIDAARTAIRLGSLVKVYYRRTREEMPAWEEDIEEAMEEGMDIEYLVSPKRFVTNNGALAGLELIRMELGTADATGRRRPLPVEGSEHLVEVDDVIVAVGQRPQLDWLTEEVPEVMKNGWPTVDPVSMATPVERLYAGGDCVTGPDTVINAVGAGQKAACAIDKLLGGKGVLPANTDASVPRRRLVEQEEEGPQRRAKMPMVSVEERRCTFEEVELGYGLEDAQREARRCLRCDLESE